MAISCRLFKCSVFGIKGRVDEPLLATSKGVKVALNFGIDLVVKSRDRREDGRFEHGAVFS